MSKIYTVSDLFFTSWRELVGKVHAEVFALQQAIDHTKETQYGHTLIQILRRLRKRPRLINKINIEQAVDIYNDLNFLNEPWYYFPTVSEKLATPEDYMAKHTFDHFIYADNEFSLYLINKDPRHLRRLVATLYQRQFDKENVDQIAEDLRLHDWQLNLVFFTYAQVREFVKNRCKALMPSAPKPAPDEIEQPATPTGGMWLKLKHRLSETPAFQGFDTAGKANLYSALDYLEDLAQQKRDAKP